MQTIRSEEDIQAEITKYVLDARKRYDDVHMVFKNLYKAIAPMPVEADLLMLSTLYERGYMRAGNPMEGGTKIKPWEESNFNLVLSMLRIATDTMQALEKFRDQIEKHVELYGPEQDAFTQANPGNQIPEPPTKLN
jgi:hypothetical protein